MNHQISALI